jgi:hypothetical protein
MFQIYAPVSIVSFDPYFATPEATTKVVPMAVAAV